MSEWEENLPPRVKEKLARIGAMTPEEGERIEASQRLDSLLAKFYSGQLKAEDLWARLKNWKGQSKEYLFRDAQMKLMKSLSLGTASEDVQKRRDGILAIEGLKENPNTSVLELGLNSIETLQKRYADEKQQAYNQLKAQVEQNPQLMTEQVRQGEATMVVQLNADQAVKRTPQWQQFLSEHERRYTREFTQTLGKLEVEMNLE